jgi:hypothetical protein
MARNNEFCIHYTDLLGPGGVRNETCKVGIPYKSVEVEISVNGEKRDMHHPCYEKACNTCQQRIYPTPEQIAERERKFKEGMERIGTIRGAIIEHCGNKKSISGSITCPCCGGTVQYSRAYNGHVHAARSTKGCARWME